MTIYEASERYNIPLEILREYESWGLCGAVKKVMGSWAVRRQRFGTPEPYYDAA